MVIEEKLIQFMAIYLYPQLKDSYEIEYTTHDGIQFHVSNMNVENDVTTIIRVLVYHETKQVLIPTIFIPIELKHKGIGKYLLKIIYEVSASFDYDVLVVDLVDSFRASLLNRGALTTSEYDVLKIVKETQLI